MDVRRRQFFILRSPSSHIFNVPSTVPADFLDLTTVDDHNVFFWTFGEVPGDFFTRRSSHLQLRTLDLSRPDSPRLRAPVTEKSGKPTSLTIVRGATYLTKRFYPRNIMHVFHDDWLGLFHLRSLWPSLIDNDDGHGGNSEIFRTALVTFDDYPGEQEYDETYYWLANYYRLEDLLDTDQEGEEEGEGLISTQYICWQDAVVGNHKELSWYQYGYGRPQGPIGDHRATGFHLREVANFIFRRLTITTWDEDLIKGTINRIRRNMLAGHGMDGPLEKPCISILSRRRNRLILNEAELELSLWKAFNLPICWVRLEDEPLPNLIVHLRRSVAAFGMHGAILILTLFLPPGAVLIEGFPWGVPPENYTPYATMARLSGMRLAYRAWTPSQAISCVGHPTRSPAEGGIAHLPQEQQEFILKATTISPHACCDNPHWLYRIFQDTIVDTQAIIGLFREGWDELGAREGEGRGDR